MSSRSPDDKPHLQALVRDELQLQEVGRNALPVLPRGGGRGVASWEPWGEPPCNTTISALGSSGCKRESPEPGELRGPEHNVPLTPGVPQHRDGHQGFQREGRPSPEPPPPPPLTLDSRGAAPLCPLHCLGCCPRPTGLDPSRRKALPATAAACCRPPSSLPASDAHTAGGPGAHLLPAAQLRTPWEAAPPTAAPRLLSAFLPFPPSGAHGWLSLCP